MTKDNKVKLIIGSHGSGKSDWIYNRFLDMSRNKNDNSKIDFSKKLILVVPEQDTNEKQRTMIKKSIEKGFGSGILNIDVVSFDRIAHNVFDILNIEPLKENVIDDDMKTMILSLVLSKLAKANKLKYCDRMVNRVGFARKLTQVVSEFYAYSVSDEEIDKVISDKKSDIYRDKLNDFKLIFDEFKKVLIDMHFSIKEDKYDLLDKRIGDVDIFENAIVAFDGFTGFTPIQLSIFKKIVEVSSDVYVTVDYRDPEEIETFNVDSDIDDTDLFYLSKKFIKDIAATVDTKSVADLFCDDSIKDTVYKYGDDKKDLSFIEKNIYRTNYEKEDIKVKNIDYFAADSIRDEVSNVVQQIFDLVRNKGYKYNDIRIIVPQIENYRNFIIKTFDKYNIPLFIDDSEKIINSPYIEVIRSALDVINYNFSYESIMRYINSGISEKSREVYEFDNFVLEHAIRGYDRYKTGFDKIKIPDGKKEKIYSIKKTFIDPLLMLYEDLSGDKSIKSYINALNNFIKNAELNEKYDVLDKQIEDLKAKDLSYSRISAVFKYSKVVVENVINDLNNLEKYKENDKVEYLASDISVEEFRRMFDAGLSNKALKSIPFSLDQVVVGDLMRSRFDNPKIEFFLGLNQSAVPSKNSDVSLIDDAIRELFANNVKELSQTTIETTLNQRFYIYLAMTNPTDKLILSYTKVNSEGDSDEKSPVLIMIEKMFNKSEDDNAFEPQRVDPDLFSFYDYEDLISYAALNMQDINNYIRKDDDGNFVYEFPDEIEKRIIRAKVVLNYLKKHEGYDEISKKILYQPKFYRDIKLNKSLNDDLLNLDKKEFKGSATSIENFNSCPYKFFMEHTLKLNDNKEYKVEPVDIGNLAHSVFENLFKDKKIVEKSKEDLHALVDKNLSTMFKFSSAFSEFDKKDKDYIGVNKLEYLKGRITDLMHHTTDVLIDMAWAMKFKTDETEYQFEFDINENDGSKDKSVLTGKIDRIDVCDIDGKTYVNVIDYKSGKKEKVLDFKDVEAGTNIQLTLYIDYCLNKKYKKGEDAPIFAGSFYFWVGEGRPREEEFNGNKNSLEEYKKKLSEEIGYNGVSNSNDEVIEAVYDSPTIVKNSRGKINAINLKNGYKLDGEYMDEETLNSYIEKMHLKVNETIDNIKNGVITAKPYKGTICNYCPYSNICRKEQLLVEEGSDSDV